MWRNKKKKKQNDSVIVWWWLVILFVYTYSNLQAKPLVEYPFDVLSLFFQALFSLYASQFYMRLLCSQSLRRNDFQKKWKEDATSSRQFAKNRLFFKFKTKCTGTALYTWNWFCLFCVFRPWTSFRQCFDRLLQRFHHFNFSSSVVAYLMRFHVLCRASCIWLAMCHLYKLLIIGPHSKRFILIASLALLFFENLSYQVNCCQFRKIVWFIELSVVSSTTLFASVDRCKFSHSLSLTVSHYFYAFCPLII